MKNEKFEKFKELLGSATALDAADTIDMYPEAFSEVAGSNLRGNSLGPMPKWFVHEVNRETHKWGQLGHDGHFEGQQKWWLFHEYFESPLAKLLGSRLNIEEGVIEAVVGNSLSVNNMFALLALYRNAINKNPLQKKIIVPATMFPSDIQTVHAVIYQTIGEKPDKYIIWLHPDKNGLYNHTEIVECIEASDDIALGCFEIINFKTGQRFDVEKIGMALHKKGAYLHVDLAHGIGNIPLNITDWGIDTAAWCSYKYLNSGPGAVGGLYVKHELCTELCPYPMGWWGLDKDTRFGDPKGYQPALGSRRFLASNDQIFNMLGLKAQLGLFEKYPLEEIFQKHKNISTYAYELLSYISAAQIITPSDWEKRGCQISFTVSPYAADGVLEMLKKKNCFCEIRGSVLRIAPTAHNTYEEIAHFMRTLNNILS
jgi:kynureninase